MCILSVDGGIPGAHYAGSLIKGVSSRFMAHSVPKTRKYAVEEDDTTWTSSLLLIHYVLWPHCIQPQPVANTHVGKRKQRRMF